MVRLAYGNQLGKIIEVKDGKTQVEWISGLTTIEDSTDLGEVEVEDSEHGESTRTHK